MKVNQEDLWAAIDREYAQGKEDDDQSVSEEAKDQEQSED